MHIPREKAVDHHPAEGLSFKASSGAHITLRMVYCCQFDDMRGLRPGAHAYLGTVLYQKYNF